MKIPSNKQAEINVLGGMMNNRAALFDGIGELTEDFFSTDETKDSYKLIEETACEHDKATASIVVKKTERPEIKALIRTADSTFVDYDSFKIDFEEVKNTHLNRQLYYITEKAKQSIEQGVKAKEIIENISGEISGLFYDDTGTNIIDPEKFGEQAYKDFEAGLENPEESYGLRFSVNIKGKMIGFPGLDEVFRGAQGGDLFLIAAKTGQGKTAIANNMARIFALYQKHSVYYENTEMKERELLERLLAPLADVKVDEIAHRQIEGSMAERQAKIQRIKKAHEHFMQSKLYLSRIPVLSATKAKALAKQVRTKYGQLDALFVDYIGRMDLEQSKGLQEWQVLFKIIQQMKELAMELDIPVFVLSQRNEDGQIEGAKKIANECDGVLFFEPISEKDEDTLDGLHYNDEQRKRINYKITKRKIRRSSNTFPIFCEFDKDKQFINEV
ncbi:DnaB-like helicase C-terminal domain-containing protein [Cytobacillus sp. FSL R5-0596]|uniref:DnaB-like helicase C-terminal domain-containing protein n=1 Tax=Cytobacillus sp. FSL R5-0596 TaxID=2954696 RepID=UPI0030F9EBE6